MNSKSDKKINGWSIESGDYNRSFKDEKKWLKRERRKKFLKTTLHLIIYFIILVLITLYILS